MTLQIYETKTCGNQLTSVDFPPFKSPTLLNLKKETLEIKQNYLEGIWHLQDLIVDSRKINAKKFQS